MLKSYLFQRGAVTSSGSRSTVHFSFEIWVPIFEVPKFKVPKFWDFWESNFGVSVFLGYKFWGSQFLKNSDLKKPDLKNSDLKNSDLKKSGLKNSDLKKSGLKKPDHSRNAVPLLHSVPRHRFSKIARKVKFLHRFSIICKLKPKIFTCGANLSTNFYISMYTWATN